MKFLTSQIKVKMKNLHIRQENHILQAPRLPVSSSLGTRSKLAKRASNRQAGIYLLPLNVTSPSRKLFFEERVVALLLERFRVRFCRCHVYLILGLTTVRCRKSMSRRIGFELRRDSLLF